MSLIPYNNNNSSNNNDSNSLTPWATFPQNIWDTFLTPPFSGRTVPYTHLAVETSGTVSAKLECLEVEAAHLIVGELPGFEKHEIHVVAEEGTFVRVTGDGRFSWRVRMPMDACLEMMTWSVENGVLTVVVPKVGLDWYYMGTGSGWGSSQRGNVRQIEIEGDDN
ncbi:hypothetical protein vseg_013820 [Gypsophila vaccaria]